MNLNGINEDKVRKEIEKNEKLIIEFEKLELEEGK